MTEPIIRDADVNDAEAIARIHVRAWQVAYRGMMPDSLLDNLSVQDRVGRWTEHLQTRAESALVVETNGAIVGWATYGESRDEDATLRTGELHGIYFDPSAWRKGLGTLLYQEVERRLRLTEFAEVTLWVIDGNTRARTFYASIGYSEDGATRSKLREGSNAPEIHVRYRKILTSELDFRRPAVALLSDFEAFRDSFLPDDDRPGGAQGAAYSDANAYLRLLEWFARGQELTSGLVPMETYWVFCQDEMAGELKVRHYLRGNLLRRGGHIGYSVQPKFRNRGFATRMLQYGLERLRQLGEFDALITCNDTNAASARVIEKCGAVRIPNSSLDGHVLRRYLIAIAPTD